MAELLLVDDEPGIQHAFRRALEKDAWKIRTAGTATAAVAEFRRARPDVVVLDVHLPDATGLDAFRRLRDLDARIPVILITGHGTTELAIQAIKEGAFEYLLKPVELPHFRETLDRALRSGTAMRTPAVMAEIEEAPAGGDLLLGRCPAMQEVYKAIGRVAGQDVTVLILGESGTGKELIARAIYQHSRRSEKPFLAINCAAIPENLLESELFGHEKGSFTGADRKRIGKFEQCHGGTIFLDEVGDMSPLTQAKILRLIQEQRFERVGGTETIQTDVRLIAATNADLAKLVDEGRFRKDLYFRLNVFSISLPPLHARGDDIAILVEHYVRLFSRELNKPVKELSPEVLAAFRTYAWPGNIRELQSVLKQALLRMTGTALLVDFLPPLLTNAAPIPGSISAPAGGPFEWDRFVAERIGAGSLDLYAEALERMEREVLVRLLKHTRGNQLQAAKILGITRGSLRTKIRALGIKIGQSVWSDDDQGD